MQPGDGEWHDTPDKAWRWKGDTSSDEIVGHYFVYPIYLELVADEAEKPALRAVDRPHHEPHPRQQLPVAGRRRSEDTWGWWGPDVDLGRPGRNRLARVAHAVPPARRDSHHRQRAVPGALSGGVRRTGQDPQYHWLTRNQKIIIPGSINHSDDELAFLSYYPLLRYEKDPALLAVYKQSLERSWQIERPERNPLWNFIYAAGTGAKEFDRAEALRTLREIPMDQIQWTVRNSQRLDVPIDPMNDRFKRRQALIVLPYDELPMSKWNGNPYNLDGGNEGRSEDDGAYYLLPVLDGPVPPVDRGVDET